MANYVTPIYVDYAGRMRKSRLTSEYYTATNRLVFKRGDTVKIGVYYLNQGTNLPYALSPSAIVKAAIKPKGKYDSTTPYTCYGYTSVTPSNTDLGYYITLPIFGEELDELLGVDGLSEDDPAYVDSSFELSWSEDGGNTWASTSEPVEVRIYNDLIRDGTQTPTLPTPPPEGLGLFAVYKETVSFEEDGAGYIYLNLAELFQLVAGDVGHFKLSMMCSRRLDIDGDNPPPNGYYELPTIDIAEGYACVDLSKTSNYNGVPGVSNTYQEFEGTEDLGTVEITLTGGLNPAPDDTFVQSSSIRVKFEHTSSSEYSHIELIGSVLIQPIAIHKT